MKCSGSTLSLQAGDVAGSPPIAASFDSRSSNSLRALFVTLAL
jgi:hypothetical protein